MTPADFLLEVRQAATALQPVITRTPLLENPEVNARLGGRLLIKAEGLQRTGAFKIRGAYSRIRQMTAHEKRNGVVTYSSGNHAQGVALAARLLGSNAMIVMPSDAPTAKIAATRALGAEVTLFDRQSETADTIVARFQADQGRIIVPPSGDDLVHAGAGTTATELFDQAQAGNAPLDAVLVPCGGGGLTAATALVMQALSPATQVFAVEPELFDDTRRSLLSGQREVNQSGAKTICDAIMTPTPNARTFAINKTFLAGGLAVSDAAVLAAMRLAFTDFGLIVEPGAAVGIAAILSHQIDITGRTIATITTGSNIDPERFCTLLNHPRNGETI